MEENKAMMRHATSLIRQKSESIRRHWFAVRIEARHIRHMRWQDSFREWQDAPNAVIADEIEAFAQEGSLPG